MAFVGLYNADNRSVARIRDPVHQKSAPHLSGKQSNFRLLADKIAYNNYAVLRAADKVAYYAIGRGIDYGVDMAGAAMYNYMYGSGKRTSNKFGSKGRGVYAKTKRRGTYGNSNSRAIARLNKRLGGFEGLELKFADYALDAVSVTTNTNLSSGLMQPATAGCFNAVPRGDGPNQRLGRFFRMRSLQFNLLVRRTPIDAVTGIPPSDCIVFIAIVLDKQTNGAPLASEDVYINPNGTVFTNGSPIRNLEHTDRFRILATRTCKLNVSGNLGYTYDTVAADTAHSLGAIEKKVVINLRLKNKKVLMTATTGVIANIQDNAVHLVAFTNAANVQISCNARMRFTTT